MATLILGNTETRFTDPKLERHVADYLSYNDHHAAYRSEHREEFDDEDEDCLRKAMETTRSERFSNWCAWRISGKHFNPCTVWTGPDGERVKGRAFHPKQMYDGYKTVTRPHADGGIVFPGGLTRMVAMFLQEHFPSADLKVIDQRANLVRWKAEPVLTVGDKTLRPDQLKAVARVVATMEDRGQQGHLFHHVLLDLAVNFGKTVVIGALVRSMVDPRVVLPFREAHLSARAVADYLEMGFSVGAIMADEAAAKRVLRERGLDPLKVNWSPQGGEEVTVAMVQTVEARVKSGKLDAALLERFGAMVIDECDAFTGDQSQAFYHRFLPGLVIGLSGTPMTNPLPSHSFAVLGMFGGHRHRVTNKDNAKAGVSLKAEAFVHLVIHGLANVPVGRAKKVALGLEGARTDALKEVLEERAVRQRLMVVVYMGQMEIKHCEWMASLIGSWGHQVELLTGEVADRQRVLARFQSGETRVLVANRVMRRGVNLPAIQVWVQWDSTANETDVIQATIGRGVRLNGQDDALIIEDFMDHGSHLAMNSLDRIAVYRNPDNGVKVTLCYPADAGGAYMKDTKAKNR